MIDDLLSQYGYLCSNFRDKIIKGTSLNMLWSTSSARLGDKLNQEIEQNMHSRVIKMELTYS